VLDAGIDGVIINMPTHRYTPGVITAVGEALKPLVGARSRGGGSQAAG
jgi:hypothetical protein